MAAQTLLGFLLDEHELSQRKLADGLGLHQGKISQLVHGKSKANNTEAVALEEFFGIPVQQLLAPMEAEK